MLYGTRVFYGTQVYLTDRIFRSPRISMAVVRTDGSIQEFQLSKLFCMYFSPKVIVQKDLCSLPGN